MILLLASCTSSEKITYLNNLPDSDEPQYFPMSIPDYKVQYRDIIYLSLKKQNVDGEIVDLLQGSSNINMAYYVRDESAQFIFGYNVDRNGDIFVPIVGKISVANRTIEEINVLVQERVDKLFNHAFVECKLLSFKYTVLGEAIRPGSYVNYNNYLTVLEAIGRAGGVNDYGRRDRVLVVRPTDDGTKTYRVNLRDKQLLSSEAYFLMPNDVVIIEPEGNKIFKLNMPTYAFLITTITSTISTTLLLINFFGNKN